MFFAGHMHFFLFALCQGVELLGYRADIALALTKLLICLQGSEFQGHKKV